MGLNERFQKGVDKAFFGGTTSKASIRVAYTLGNIIVFFLLFYILLNTVALNFIGQLHSLGSGISLLIPGLDDAIPFIPQSVIFYVYVFGALEILTILYFAFVAYDRGYALGWSLVFIEIVAAVVYIILPVSVAGYRQYFLGQPANGDFWMTQATYVLNYFTSTFNCFPSLHAAGSTICAYAWYKYSKLKPRRSTKAVAIIAFISTVGIILSTLFLKQHYIADEVAGIALALVAGKLVFNRLWKPLGPTGFLIATARGCPSGNLNKLKNPW